MACADDSRRGFSRLGQHAFQGGIVLQQSRRHHFRRCLRRASIRRATSSLSLRLAQTGSDDGRTRARRDNARTVDHGLAIRWIYRRMAASGRFATAARGDFGRATHNLGNVVWFGLHVFFPGTGVIDWFAIALCAAAFVAMLRYRVDVIPVVLASGLLGLIYKFV